MRCLRRRPMMRNFYLKHSGMAKKILIKYGGHLSRITKKEEEWIESESNLSLGSLLIKTYERYRNFPEGNFLGNKFAFLTTLNGEFIPASSIDEVLLKDGDVVVLFPPVSGG